MSTAAISRNGPCPCGSGQKYKRCCLARDETEEREGLFIDAVARRIQDWSAKRFADELGVAVDLYVGPDRVLLHDDLMLFAT